MKNIQRLKKILLKEKSFIQKEYNIAKIGIFGSYIRGEESEKSDIDILVEFRESIGFFKFLELEEYLGKKLELKVDLVSKKALKPRIGKYILNEVIMV